MREFLPSLPLRGTKGVSGNYVRGNTMRRLRTAKDGVKGKPNALQGVLQLPAELLFDILELAHPMDLMHLSRTSKDLRKVVLSKRSEPV